jgi:hypothetical protein
MQIVNNTGMSSSASFTFESPIEQVKSMAGQYNTLAKLSRAFTSGKISDIELMLKSLPRASRDASDVVCMIEVDLTRDGAYALRARTQSRETVYLGTITPNEPTIPKNPFSN